MSTYWITHNDETVGGPFSTFNDAAEARRAIKQLTGAPVGDLRIGGEEEQRYQSALADRIRELQAYMDERDERDEGMVPKSGLDQFREYLDDPLCGHPRGQR